jgi:hypothetical protein
MVDICARMAGSQAKSRYSRLFQPPAEPPSETQEEKLIQLGSAMRYDVEREGTLSPRVGYTYFGQFVCHDLTHDPTPIDGPYLNPELTLKSLAIFADLNLSALN